VPGNDFLGMGYECTRMHNPIIRRNHHYNTWQDVATHIFAKPLDDPAAKTGNRITTPCLIRRSDRNPVKNLENTPRGALLRAKQPIPVPPAHIFQQMLN
jgi:hypothetical protein